MLDYIYVDYLYYIFRSFFFISIGVFCACVIYMVVYGNNKVVQGFLIFSVVAFLFAFIYPNFEPMGGGPHYNCNSQFEREAQNIDAAISNYFSEPTRTQIPSYSDLINSGDYPLENIDLKRRDKLIKESELSVDILGDDIGEITIVLSSKEGKCPFYRWKCPRQIRGEIYVRRMGGSGANGWLNGYEDI
jgi:hypothetical protein